ncbi:MAG: 2-aminoethylphosphonate--pyruvate transaminase [Alphaproteobacteria bacterium]
MTSYEKTPSAASRAQSPTGDPWLLTPGPLTTSPTVKEAMLHDLGSRDRHFIAVNRRVRERLLSIVNGAPSHVCVPLQGSGTFVVEAMIGTFVPMDGKLLILVNGAYGKRMARICAYYGLAHDVIEVREDRAVDPAALDRRLAAEPDVSHVAVVHTETTSGVLNPVEAVAEVTARHGRSLLIDAMSSFGALPLDAQRTPFEALVASSNKCLEGVPGVGFCIARRDALEKTKGNAPSLSLDLHDQWSAMEANGQWRFTPPVHVILALDKALDEFEAEGGTSGRCRRYRENCRILLEGLHELGFETLLDERIQAPNIVTVKMPADPRFDFDAFYARLGEAGYVIYPGKLTVAESFRIGCIGRLGGAEMRGALEVIRTTLRAMGVASPAAGLAGAAKKRA